MYCKNCGGELKEGYKFCSQCGVLIGNGEAFCDECGGELPFGEPYCPYCGKAFFNSEETVLIKGSNKGKSKKRKSPKVKKQRVKKEKATKDFATAFKNSKIYQYRRIIAIVLVVVLVITGATFGIYGIVKVYHSANIEDDSSEPDNGASESTNGETITFGSYPQTKVTDSVLTATLSSMAGILPTSDNPQGWTSYNYYIGGDAQDYAWYRDVVNGNDKYRGVYFTSYRPYYTTYSSSTSNTYQDDNGYYISTTYWFKYEPIEWRVLSKSANDGKAFVMANLAIDSQQYDYDGSYNNDYAESTIRAWLNDNFYNTAFTTSEQSQILTTTVDNSAASTGYTSNSYACEDTYDKVFLLSYAEVVNTAYGFSSSYTTYDAERQLKSSDYAKAQGCYQSTSSNYYGNCWWWLRSPNADISIDARNVYSDGYVDSSDGVFSTSDGVVPALNIRLS